MNDTKKMIDIAKAELAFLKEKQSQLRTQLENAPAGSLHISSNNGKAQNYFYNNETGKKKYLRKDESELISSLAQKEYDSKVLSNIESKVYFLERLIKSYQRSYLELYDTTDDYRKKIIKPIICDDKTFVENWYKEHPGSQNRYYIKSEIITERGELVRSKSEKITADIFFKRNIPYIYEAELRINNHITLYPDFMILNIRTRKTYIYEHFGMMDNPEYAENAVKKINEYEKAGWVVGVNLVIAMETSKTTMSTNHINEVINIYFQ